MVELCHGGLLLLPEIVQLQKSEDKCTALVAGGVRTWMDWECKLNLP